MKKFELFVFVLAAFLVVSTSALPRVARSAPQCPANDVGTAVFFPDPTNCKYVWFCNKNKNNCACLSIARSGLWINRSITFLILFYYMLYFQKLLHVLVGCCPFEIVSWRFVLEQGPQRLRFRQQCHLLVEGTSGEERRPRATCIYRSKNLLFMTSIQYNKKFASERICRKLWFRRVQIMGLKHVWLNRQNRWLPFCVCAFKKKCIVSQRKKTKTKNSHPLDKKKKNLIFKDKSSNKIKYKGRAINEFMDVTVKPQ